MFICLVSGFSIVAQKARKERAPEAIVVRPIMLVVGSKGMVFVNRPWDQKSIIFLLVVSAPVPPWGNGRRPVGRSAGVTGSMWPLQESGMLP